MKTPIFGHFTGFEQWCHEQWAKQQGPRRFLTRKMGIFIDFEVVKMCPKKGSLFIKKWSYRAEHVDYFQKMLTPFHEKVLFSGKQ